MVSEYEHQNSQWSNCTIIVLRDCFVELAVILGPIFPLMFIEISE